MRNHRIFITTFFFFLWFTSLHAQLFDVVDDKGERVWELTLAPYGHLAAQATDVGDERLRQSFSDLSSLTNSGFQLIAGVRYKRWVASFDGTWANLGADQSGDILKLGLNIDQQILDFRLGYLVYRNLNLESNQVIDGWSLGVNLGAKYWLNDVSLSYELSAFNLVIDQGSLIETQEWTDFMIGIAPSFLISKSVTISAQASIGGFGLGNSSILAYDWTFLNSFKVAKPLYIHAGFRNFFYKREDGSGGNLVTTKVNVLGPFLGVSLSIL